MTADTQPQTPAKLKPAQAPPPGGRLLEEYPRLPNFTPALHAKLRELCGPRWIDLLFHLPTRTLDRSATPTIAAAPVGEVVTIAATVTKRGALPPRHVKRPLAVELTDGTAPLRALYFNPAPWLERAYPVGETVILSGKMEADAKGKKLIHPDVFSPGKGVENVARVWPLYPLTAGVGQGWLARAIAVALKVAAEHPLPEWLPAPFREAHHLPTFTEALRAVHQPQAEADLLPASRARTRLAVDELYATQLALQHARATTRAQAGIAHGSRQHLREKLVAGLPFPLTADQTGAIAEIVADLAAPRPMLRLLQGDVGSGKTLVALAALLHVIENGHQGVLMAPTELLARQLHATAKRLLEPLGITVALLTGSLGAAQKRRLKQHVAQGFVQLLVGTHALTEDNVTFSKLGLAVIDEQHRFGVRQRLALSANQPLPPDLLVMTATPIPRTLALTLYGDMDTSVLRHKPPGRTPVQTLAMPEGKLPQIAARLQQIAARRQQAYWVCPLVEESEESDLTAAATRCAWLQAHYAGHPAPPSVALLHGKMKAKEKEDVMGAFRAGEISILVSTTVIEVGVDVPNATVMVIEHAERFGLSQLHQLRGRVGRGTQASHCILLYSPPLSTFAQQRLQALRDSEDGFHLAEKDLELRGPGEVLGSRQSGEVKTRLADLHHHQQLIPFARDLAEKAVTRPLTAAQRNALALLLTTFNRQSAATWLRGG